MYKNKIIKNYLYNISFQLLVMILPLITTPYVSRVIGADGIGAYSYTQSLTYYFILFGCVGLNLYGQKEIAYVQDDKKRRSSIFFELIFIRFFTNGVSIALFSLIFLGHTRYHTLFLIQILDIAASCIDISWFFQGLEDFKKIVIRNFIIKLAGVIMIFTLVKQPGDLYLYVLCYSSTLFLGNASMWIYIPRFVSKVSWKAIELKKHVRPALILFLPQIATSIYNVLDKTMIGALTGIDAEVAYYEQAQKIVKVALAFITSLGVVMLPRVAAVFSQRNFDQIKLYMSRSFQFVFFLGLPLTFGLIGISKGLVPWFYGEGFDKVYPNIIIISPIILVVGITNVIGVQYLLPTNRQKDYLISVVVGSLINLCMNFLLIPRMQSIGAAASTIIAETSVMICQIYFVRKEFDICVILKGMINYLFGSGIMLIVIVFLSRRLPVSIISTLIEIFAGILIYILVLFILKDNVLDKCKNKIIKR